METKICVKCNQNLDICNFYITRGKYLTSRCKKCLLEYGKQYIKKYRSKKETKEKYNKYRRDRKKVDVEYKNRVNKQKLANAKKDIAKYVFLHTKGRAKRRNIEFTLLLDDIVIPSVCPILETPFILGTKSDYRYTPTIDRIDNSKGYIKGNIQIISMLANTMKSSASKSELIKFSKNILKYISKDDIVQTIENQNL